MSENTNIDVRMSNYLAILGSAEMRKNFDPDVVRLMEQSVAIYAATTSKEYIDDFKKKQQAEEKREEVVRAFNKYIR